MPTLRDPRTVGLLAMLMLAGCAAQDTTDPQAPSHDEGATAPVMLDAIPEPLLGEWEQVGETSGDGPQAVSLSISATSVIGRYPGVRTDGELWVRTLADPTIQVGHPQTDLLLVYGPGNTFVFKLENGQLCNIASVSDPADPATGADGPLRLACYRRAAE